MATWPSSSHSKSNRLVARLQGKMKIFNDYVTSFKVYKSNFNSCHSRSYSTAQGLCAWFPLVCYGFILSVLPISLRSTVCLSPRVLRSKIKYNQHLSRQQNCWSLRCSWSIACRCCSNYIFILKLTPEFSGLSKDNWKTRREISKFWDLVCLY